MTLSVAISPCPNDTFVFHALATGALAGAPSVDLRFADIEECNALAAAGAADVVKVSYAALPDLLDDYLLLPAGGALGRGCGPLVLTRGTTELAGRRIAVPGLRTTAYLLLRLWAAQQVPGGFGEIVPMPFDRILPAVRDGAVEAGLVIHESRFTYPSYGLVAVQDLGDWWERDSGLPIPLGAIVARRSLGDARIGSLTAAVRASVEAAWAHPAAARPWILEHAQETAPDVVDAHIELYVNEFTRDLGDEGYAAVEALLARAAEAGLVSPVGALR